MYIRDTEVTPKINFNIEQNIFEISGRSLPEDAVKFYEPILEWVDTYYNGEPLKHTKFDFKIEYFNTASSKMIFEILTKLGSYHSLGYETEVGWYVDDDDENMQEAGEEFSDLIEVPIKIYTI